MLNKFELRRIEWECDEMEREVANLYGSMFNFMSGINQRCWNIVTSTFRL